MKVLEIWTDGAAKNNGKGGAVGGWGIYVKEGENYLFSANGGAFDTTNQKMELTAVIKACDFYTVYKEKHLTELIIYTDSAYIYNCWKDKWYKKWQNNNWTNSKSQPVANKELWEQLIPYFENDLISFFKVKGHSTNEGNIAADKLAVDGARRFQNSI